MTDETTKLETAVTDAAGQAGVDGSTVDSTIDSAIAESKSFLNKAQEALTEAVDTVVGAVKEHPITAASIAAGATAAVAGAAYGASKLLSSDDDSGPAKGRAKNKS